MNSDITTKIKKYQSGYVNGECRSNEYEAEIKREKRLHMKLDLADTLFNEIPFINNNIKDFTKHLITLFPNFKELHSKATNEEIILSFILYATSLETQKNTDFQDTTIQSIIQEIIPLEKQETYQQTYTIIHWKITLHFIQKQPILPTEPENINHNILYKG